LPQNYKVYFKPASFSLFFIDFVDPFGSFLNNFILFAEADYRNEIQNYYKIFGRRCATAL